MKITGILRQVDIGAGGWKLECSDGSSYDLYGAIPPELVNKRVIVTGTLSEGFGVLRTASQSLQVDSIVSA